MVITPFISGYFGGTLEKTTKNRLILMIYKEISRFLLRPHLNERVYC